MKVFVFEYVTGGGIADGAMLTSLVGEGDMMLTAAVRDLLALGDVEVSVCRDPRLDLPGLPVTVYWVGGDWHEVWKAGLRAADAVLPIAPETDGVLEMLCREIVAAGKILLNSSPAAVAIAASKFATLECLAAEAVPVVPAWRGDRLDALQIAGVDAERPLVVKPDQGVGCGDIHVFPGLAGVREFLATRDYAMDWVVQPYLEGEAASLSLLVDDGCVCLLGTNRQRVVQIDDGFQLLGCEVNGLDLDRDAMRDIAQGVCRAIPGLWGYVGVDLVLTAHGPVVLEVNPRLTTSYAGLSQSLGVNVAALLLRRAGVASPPLARDLRGDCVHVDLEFSRVA